MLPPLRGESDRARLRAAITSGEADALISLHRPLTEEETRVEFAYAEVRSRNLGVRLRHRRHCPRRRTAGRGLPRAVAIAQQRAWPPVHLVDGGEGDSEFTLFLPDAPYSVPDTLTGSLGANPAVVGESLRGLAVGVCIGGEYLPGAFAKSILGAT